MTSLMAQLVKSALYQASDRSDEVNKAKKEGKILLTINEFYVADHILFFEVYDSFQKEIDINMISLSQIARICINKGDDEPGCRFRIIISDESMISIPLESLEEAKKYYLILQDGFKEYYKHKYV